VANDRHAGRAIAQGPTVLVRVEVDDADLPPRIAEPAAAGIPYIVAACGTRVRTGHSVRLRSNALTERINHTERTVMLAIRKIFGVQHSCSGGLGGVDYESVPK
jgi:hypothetical protein